MQNPRKYGNAPFRVAVVHGGPGAAGEMAPVARELADSYGVLEPLQTATTVTGQVEELESLLEGNAELPATLIGFSWGAWLCVLFAAQKPGIIRKLILVGSGPFEEKYAEQISSTRLNRLNAAERAATEKALRELAGPGPTSGRSREIGKLFSRADSFDPLPDGPDAISFAPEIFSAVWPEAAELRRAGKLLDAASRIRCPVAAIHGDYDPHPADGVRVPLSRILPDSRFHLLKNCGHRPWLERQSRDHFFALLRAEILKGDRSQR